MAKFVHIIDIELNDKKRNRKIPLRSYVPQQKGTYPVIIFSHGLGGSREGYQYLGEHWSQNGYVVLLPTHLGSDKSSLTSLRDLLTRDKMRPYLVDPHNVSNRPRDISFVIDSLYDIQAQLAEGIVIDQEQIGVGGHSFGAYTTLAVAGATVNLEGVDEQYQDPRVKSILVISAQGERDLMFGDKPFSNITLPALVITATKDRSFFGTKDYHWRTQVYQQISSAAKHLLVLDGAHHMTFAAKKERTARYLDIVQDISLSFWDTYLKASGKMPSKLTNSLVHSYCSMQNDNSHQC